MRKLLMLCCMALPFLMQAQVSKVTLQASGLTCSMCTNAIHKSLKGLDFVKDVQPNIKNSTFDLSFNNGDAVDFDKIRKAVEDAGFFVAKFYAVVKFNNVEVTKDSHISEGGRTYHFMNVQPRTLEGEKTVRLLDKGFVSNK